MKNIFIIILLFCIVTSSAWAKKYYFVSVIPGLINSPTSYPFCAPEECDFYNINDIRIIFNDNKVGFSENETNKVLDFFVKDDSNELDDIRLYISDESVISNNDVNIDIENRKLTISKFAKEGYTTLILSAIDNDKVASMTKLNISVGETAFITSWETEMNNQTVRMPTDKNYNYNGEIDWGDGSGSQTFHSYNDGDFTHTYEKPGKYDVVIKGTFEALDTTYDTYFPYEMKTVENLGKVGWKSFRNAFSYSVITEFNVGGGSDTTGVRYMERMFQEADGLTYLNLNRFDTSEVVSMDSVFLNASNIEELYINTLDVSKVKSLSQAFRDMSRLKKLKVNDWNTESLENINCLFFNSRKLVDVDISKWNMSKVNRISHAFTYSGLKDLDLSLWDVSNVRYLYYMFYGQENLNLSGWDLKNAIDITAFIRNNIKEITYDKKVDVDTYTSMLKVLSYDVASKPKNIIFHDGGNDCEENSICINYRQSLIDNAGWVFDNYDIQMKDSFKTEWVVHAGQTIRIPTDSSYSYDGFINWGDGTGNQKFDNPSSPNLAHTYNNAGRYKVKIYGKFEALNTSDNYNFPSSMKAVINLGDVGWKTFKNAFRNSSINIFSTKDASYTDVTDVSGMFLNTTKLTTVNLSKFNFSNISNADKMFEGSSLLNITLNKSNFSSINRYANMFKNTNNLNTINYSTSVNNSLYENILNLLYSSGIGNNITFHEGSNSCESLGNCAGYLNNLANSKNWKFDNYPIAGSGGFITTWKVSNNETVKMPTANSNYKYNGTINWGDGTGDKTFSSYNDPNFTHTYAKSGIYTVSITGTFEALNTKDDKEFPIQMKTVESLGDVGWKTFIRAFNYSKITDFNVGNTDTSKVINVYKMFDTAINLTSLDLSKLDTSSVKYMNNMFANNSNLEYVDLSTWNTSNVENTSYMFMRARNIDNLDVSNWDTSKIKNMRYMFFKTVNLKSLDVSNWNISNVTDMFALFAYCERINNLDVSNWDTSNVKSMAYLFRDSKKLETLDISNWDISNVTSTYAMFYNCPTINNLDVSNWNTSEIKNTRYMFYNCNKLKNIDISNWNVSKLQDMREMFLATRGLTELNFNNWILQNLTLVSRAFSTLKIKTLDLSSWADISLKLKNIDRLIQNASIETLTLNGWDMSNINQAEYLFSKVLKDLYYTTDVSSSVLREALRVFSIHNTYPPLGVTLHLGTNNCGSDNACLFYKNKLVDKFNWNIVQ